MKQMKKMSESLRARLNLLVATAVAFAFGLGLASALDLTPLSIAASDRSGPKLVIGAPDAPDVSMNGGFADVVDRVAPAVLTVFAEGERQIARRIPDFQLPPGYEEFGPEEDEGEGEGTQLVPWSGSGFIISADGYVLTNNHVVEGASRIDLQLADQRVFEYVEVVGTDPQTDVALLKIAGANDLPVTPLGNSLDTRVGEWVLAIGSPGFGGINTGPLETSVTAGIVSQKGRNIQILRSRNNLAIEDFIQTDAVINRGNSGGPLVNAAGEVIGINTAIASTNGLYQGYGFAVPIELAREVIDDLVEYGEIRRALIGVGITDVRSADARFYGLDEVYGAVVGSFSFDESPARLAGIEIGDVIVGVEGQTVSGVSELQRRIRAFEPGETVELDIVRRATRERDVARVRLIAAETTDTDVARRPGSPTPPVVEEFDDPLGIEVAEVDRGTRREFSIPNEIEGVVITAVADRGPLWRIVGERAEGAVIVDLNGTPIRTLADYDRVRSALAPGDVASLILQTEANGGGWTNQVFSLVIPQR